MFVIDNCLDMKALLVVLSVLIGCRLVDKDLFSLHNQIVESEDYQIIEGFYFSCKFPQFPRLTVKMMAFVLSNSLSYLAVYH